MTRRFAAAFVILALCRSLAGGQLAPEVRSRALKVVEALEKLEAEQVRAPSPTGRSYVVSEADLNAWIAYRIATEMEKFVKSCELKLLDGDRAEGRLVIDLSGTPAAVLLSSRADIFFAASAESRDGKIRITMERLFLGNQRLSPDFLDTVIGFVAGLEGKPATSLKDWYPLPYGIRRLQSGAGRLVCHY
jgi:hypothetical protein